MKKGLLLVGLLGSVLIVRLVAAAGGSAACPDGREKPITCGQFSDYQRQLELKVRIMRDHIAELRGVEPMGESSSGLGATADVAGDFSDEEEEYTSGDDSSEDLL